MRLTFKRRVVFVFLSVAFLFLIFVHLIRLQYNRSSKSEHDPCSTSGDRRCTSRLPVVTDFPTTRRLPRLDSGAHWCRGNLKDPHFASARQERQEWQPVAGRSVRVFSAFYDNRRNLGGPMVRILADGLQEEFNQVGSLFCSLWFDDADIAINVGPVIYDRIYPSTRYPEMWVAHFILCPVPTVGIAGAPSVVSITDSVCGRASNALAVLGRTPLEVPEYSFAVCYPPAYGNLLDGQVFTEWIEVNRLLGARSVWFYNFSMEANVTRIIRSYLSSLSLSSSSSFSVNVVQWRLPKDQVINYFSQHTAINDCLYRAGRGHRFVAVHDIDEVLVPRKHADWPDMMKYLFRPNVGAYLFQHAYFRRNTTGELPYLITQQSLWRTDVVVPSGKIRCKAMYNADKVIKADIHFPYALVDRYQEYILPPEVAMLHHYRISPMEGFRKHPERYRFIEDEYMLRYKEKLTLAFVGRIQTLYTNTTVS